MPALNNLPDLEKILAGAYLSMEELRALLATESGRAGSGDCAGELSALLDSLAARKSMQEPSAWEGHIDSVCGGVIRGWARKKDREMPQYVSLFQNGQLIIKYLAANQAREDLAAKGIGAYAFEHGCEPELAPWILFHIEDPQTGCPIAVRLASAAQLQLAEKIAPQAMKMLTAGDDTGAAILLNLCLADPANFALLSNSVRALMDAEKYREISQILESTPHRARLLTISLIIRMMWASREDDLKRLEHALELAMLIPKENRGPGYVNYTGQLMDALCAIAPEPVYKILSRNFAASYVFSDQNPNHTDLFANRICVYAPTLTRLAYTVPVVQCLPYFLVDIVIDAETPQDDKFISEYNLGKFRIRKGHYLLKEYKIILTEQHEFSSLHNNLNLRDIKLIILTVGLDSYLYYQYETSLFIAETEYQTDLETFKFHVKNWTRAQREALGTIPHQQKCEYAYSGLYHFGKYLNPAERDKRKLRAELEEMVQRKIPSGKPLIAFFTDTVILHNQSAYGLNKLADSCTIVAKFLHLSDPIKAMLNPGIIIYDDPSFAPNVMRFAADWIICGFMGGTALSSLALGLPLITVYSRLQLHIGDPKSQIFAWDKFLKASHRFPQDYSLWRYYRYWKKHFDILDYQAIKKAIFEPAYLEWYRENIGELQKKIFGQYLLENAPQATAELVLRFASDGTLGNKCNAVNLHDSCYKTGSIA